MKPILLLISLAFASLSFTNSNASKAAAKTVYMCVSSTSSRYHAYESCSCLNRCTHPIKGMSVSEAESMGKTPCHICKP